MKAAVMYQYGSPDVIALADVPDLSPDSTEILVDVHATAVTQGDRRLRAADFPGFTAIFGRLIFGVLSPRKPIMGTMFAGCVRAVGDSVTRFKPGDRVFGSVMSGAYAEQLVVDESSTIVHMPENASYAEAAALPYGAGTSMSFIEDMAKVQEGERVLVLGASGGVGRFAVQFAKSRGAYVIGVCSGRTADIALDAGADEVINYQEEDFKKNGQKYDVIFDTAEVASYADVRGSLKATGRFLTLFASISVLLQMAYTSVFGSKRALFGVAAGSQEQLDQLAVLWKDGAISPKVDRCFPFAEIANAHSYLESGVVRGTVVVQVA